MLNNYIDRAVKAVSLNKNALRVTFEDEQTLTWPIVDGWIWIGGMEAYSKLDPEVLADAFRRRMEEPPEHE